MGAEFWRNIREFGYQVYNIYVCLAYFHRYSLTLSFSFRFLFCSFRFFTLPSGKYPTRLLKDYTVSSTTRRYSEKGESAHVVRQSDLSCVFIDSTFEGGQMKTKHGISQGEQGSVTISSALDSFKINTYVHMLLSCSKL